MAITVVIAESNGAGETVTDNITTSHYGTTDTVNIAAATTEPITVGNNSFSKAQRLHWDSGTGVRVQTIKHWRSTGATPSNTNHYTNLDETTPADGTYFTPTASDIGPGGTNAAPNAMPTSEPTNENVDETNLTSSGTYSGYVFKQVQPGASATDGLTTGVETWQWEEVA